MKDGIPILLLCIVAIGGIGFWLSRLDAFNPTRSTVVTRPSAEDVKDKRQASSAVKSSAVKPKTDAKQAKQHAVEETTLIVPVGVAEISHSNVPPPNPPPVPSADQIRIDTDKRNITEKFGIPALSSMTTDRGHAIETFVYGRGRDRPFTIIRFKDGKVFSASSQ